MRESKVTAAPFYLLQVRAFQCSARCCEDQSSSQVVVQSCLQDCMRPVVEAESRIKEEVQQLQVLLLPRHHACRKLTMGSGEETGIGPGEMCSSFDV